MAITEHTATPEQLAHKYEREVILTARRLLNASELRAAAAEAYHGTNHAVWSPVWKGLAADRVAAEERYDARLRELLYWTKRLEETKDG